MTIVSGLALGIDGAASQRRVGGRRTHDRRGNRLDRVPACTPRACTPHCRARPDHQRVQPRYRVTGSELSAAQPHHRRLSLGRWWSRRPRIGLVITARHSLESDARCSRSRDRFIRRNRAAACLDQARRQTGRRHARCARRAALGARAVVGSVCAFCRRRATRCAVGRHGVRASRDGSVASAHRLADGAIECAAARARARRARVATAGRSIPTLR